MARGACCTEAQVRWVRRAIGENLRTLKRFDSLVVEVTALEDPSATLPRRATLAELRSVLSLVTTGSCRHQADLTTQKSGYTITS